MITTVREWLRGGMTHRGLWVDEIDAVLLELGEILSSRLDTPIDGYAPEVRAAMWLAACDDVRRYLDAHKPQHFARGMFLVGDR